MYTFPPEYQKYAKCNFLEIPTALAQRQHLPVTWLVAGAFSLKKPNHITALLCSEVVTDPSSK